MSKIYSDETLMAFADGELDEARAAEIEAAIAVDDTLILRLAAFSETRSATSMAFAPMLETEVPPALKISVEQMVAAHEARSRGTSGTATSHEDVVVPFTKRQSGQWSGSYMAMAASIALVTGGAIGYVASTQIGSGDRSNDLHTAQILGAGAVKAIETVASGHEILLQDGSRFRAIASFEDADKNLCREVELDTADKSTIVAVTCASNGFWDVRLMVAAAPVSDGYAPASSLEALDAYLQAVDAGAPLTAEDEAKALATYR